MKSKMKRNVTKSIWNKTLNQNNIKFPEKICLIIQKISSVSHRINIICIKLVKFI